MIKEITLVYNPKSGSSLPLYTLRKKFQKHGIEIGHTIAIGPDFEANMKKAVSRHDTIAVIGGDGTISSAIGPMVNSPAVLAPLPGGTLNHFTRDLGISQDLDEAIRHLKQAKIRKIDAARVNKTIFINNSSIGLYPNSLKTREKVENNIGKWPGAAFAMIKAFVMFRTYRVTLNNHEPFTTPFIFVGNNSYKLSDFGATDRTQLDKGILSVYIVRTFKRIALVKLFFSALVGRLHDADEFEAFTTTKLVVETMHKKVHVSHDGEVSREQGPLEYESLPSSIRVLV